MKKLHILLTGCLIIFLTQASFAQNKWTFGIKGGVNLGTPIGKAEEGATGSLGFGPRGGFFLRYNVNSKVSLQPELTYSFKGASFLTPISGDTTIAQEILGQIYYLPTFYEGWVDGEFANHYIDIPILGMYYIGDKMSLLLGPYVAYLIKGKNAGLADLEIGDNYTTVEDEIFDISNQLSQLDYGLVVGANYETFAGLNLGLRLTSGLKSIYKKTYGEVDGVVRNLYLQASVGYRFFKKPILEEAL